MRMIDADALKDELLSWAMVITNPKLLGTDDALYIIDSATTICCETCKYGWKGECISDREYVSCTKPYDELSNHHIKDCFCGDWRDKDAID